MWYFEMFCLRISFKMICLQGGMDIVPVRLRNAVLRIVARSKHRAYYLPQKDQPPGATTPTHVRSCLRHMPC